VWIRIDRAVQINLKLLRSSLRILGEASGAYNDATLRRNILKETRAFLDALNIDWRLVVLTVNYDTNFILADTILDKNVNLAVGAGCT
jgi:hypothetical protein